MSAPGDKQKAKNTSPDWQTPPELFNYLNKMYNFTTDGAASDEHHLCDEFYSEQDSAFNYLPAERSIFVNPPYGNLSSWMELFARWGQFNTVVALVPAAPDTAWWNHGFQYATQTVLMGPGRVRFIDPRTGQPGNSNTVASCLFVYDNMFTKSDRVKVWDWRKDVFSN